MASIEVVENEGSGTELNKPSTSELVRQEKNTVEEIESFGAETVTVVEITSLKLLKYYKTSSQSFQPK